MEQRKYIKYITSSRDGKVKIWNGLSMKCEFTINVSEFWVTAITFMTLSKRLVCASANRTISFYELNMNNIKQPVSRIDNLDGIPLCLEYYRWPTNNNDGKLETLLVGDDLGICHMYNFTSKDWHYCEHKLGTRLPTVSFPSPK